MENWARLFAYGTGVMVLGLAIIVFTESLLVFVNDPGWHGYVTLMGYGLIYLNLSYGVNRQFIRKKFRGYNLSYFLATLIFIPPAVWVYVKDVGLYEARPLFLTVLLFACLLGAYFGIKSGIKKRNSYLKNVNKHDLPEDLRKPQDKINRN